MYAPSSAGAARMRISACVQQSDANILSAETGRANEIYFVFATLPKINIRTGFKKGLDQGHFRAFWYHTVEYQVGDIVQRMVCPLLTVLTVRHEGIGLCRIGRENPAKRCGVAASEAQFLRPWLLALHSRNVRRASRMQYTCNIVAESLYEQAICSPRRHLEIKHC